MASSRVSAYIAQVDRVLAAGESLFPQAAAAPGALHAGGSQVPAAPAGSSSMATGSGQAGVHYQGAWTRVAGVDADATATAHAAIATAQQGRAGATTVRQTAQTAAAALAPTANTPAGMRLLVSTMDDRMAAMQRQIGATKAQNQALVSRFHGQVAEYRGAIPTDLPKNGPDDTIVGPSDGPRIVNVDNPHTDGDPRPPQAAVDPRNPFVGDERFGQWVDVVPPPYTGDTPPPPWTGHRDFPPETMEIGQPKGPAGPSGFYTPGGRPWADGNAPPMADWQEQYAFRMSGQDYTPYTRMVDGHQQQWVQNTYEAREWTRVNINGPAWAGKDPNPITGELGGTTTGGLGGISPPPYMHPWRPIGLNEIATLSGQNPTVPFYVPDGCGGKLTFQGGVPHGGLTPPPVIPSMTAGP